MRTTIGLPNLSEKRMFTSDILYYRFAQVIATTADGQQVHVRWFDHSAKTDLLSYFERPMELFLSRRCGYVARNHVERVVEVKLLELDEKPPNREQHYYFR